MTKPKRKTPTARAHKAKHTPSQPTLQTLPDPSPEKASNAIVDRVDIWANEGGAGGDAKRGKADDPR